MRGTVDAAARRRALGVLTILSWLALWLAVARPLSWATLAVGAVLLAASVWLGLAAASPWGRGAPLLEGREDRGAGRRLALGFVAGLALGAALLVVLLWVLAPFEPALTARFARRIGAPVWQPLVLSVESSILEEVVFRLGLLSGLVWLLARGWRGGEGRAGALAVWTAIGLSSLAFALVHLPAWLAVAEVTAPLIASVLLLNAAAGVALGQIFWQWGIEAAILGHFAADFVVQSLGPRLVG